MWEIDPGECKRIVHAGMYCESSLVCCVSWQVCHIRNELSHGLYNNRLIVLYNNKLFSQGASIKILISSHDQGFKPKCTLHKNFGILFLQNLTSWQEEKKMTNKFEGFWNKRTLFRKSDQFWPPKHCLCRQHPIIKRHPLFHVWLITVVYLSAPPGFFLAHTSHKLAL